MAFQVPKTFAELEAYSDEELRQRYDEIGAQGPAPMAGVGFILDELARRREVRLVRLTWFIAWLTLFIAVMTGVVMLVTLTD